MTGCDVRTVHRRVVEWMDGVNVWVPASEGKAPQGRYTERGARARLWLEDLQKELGDQSPESKDIYLPPCPKSDYYREYINENPDGVKLPTFLRIWNWEFNNLKIPRQKRLGKCKKCAHLKEKLATCESPKERLALKQERREHLLQCRLERKEYHKNRAFAKKYPKDTVVIILDGMDKKKARLPAFFEHDGSENEKLDVRITGAIAHGRPNPFYAWIITQYTAETNTNISCLIQVLLLEYSHFSRFSRTWATIYQRI